MASGGKRAQKAHPSFKTQGLDTRSYSIYEFLTLLLKISIDQPSVGAEVLLQLLCPPAHLHRNSPVQNQRRADLASSWEQSLAMLMLSLSAASESELVTHSRFSEPSLTGTLPLLPSAACHRHSSGSHLLPPSTSRRRQWPRMKSSGY